MRAQQAMILIVVVVITTFALLLLAGHQSWAGPVLFTVTGTHGVDVGDIPVVGLWAAGVIAAASLWRRSHDDTDGDQNN